MLIIRKSSIHFSRIFFGSGARHTRSKTTLFKRPRFCQRKMCKFDLITLRWHRQIFQSLPSDTNPQFITSICKALYMGFFALSGWHSKQPNNKRVKDWFKKSSAMKHKRKVICEFVDSFATLKKFCCSTEGFFLAIVIIFGFFDSDCHLAARVLFERSKGCRVPLGVSTGSFFRDGVLRQVDPLGVKDSWKTVPGLKKERL